MAKKVRLNRMVRVDGVDLDPGVHTIPDGNAESILAAGWGVAAVISKVDSDLDGDIDEDDVDPEADLDNADPDVPPEAPKRKRPTKKAAKRS